MRSRTCANGAERRHPLTNKLIRLLLICASLIVVLVNASAIDAGAEQVANKFLFVVHVAGLYAKSPDQSLEIPVQGVIKRQIADTWHVPRAGDRLHEGQDIFAKRGTPVLSATDGYIVRIGENSLGGQTVSVLGAGGRIYYYAHLDSYAPNIATGDHVTPQSILGYVGNTGNAAGGPTHLHFAVYELASAAVNPLPLLTDRPEEKTKVTVPNTKRARNRH